MKSIETNDIVLAAYLKVKGYSLDSIRKDGNRGIFCFSGVDDEALSVFDMGKGSVEPLEFNNAIKSLTTAVRRAI